MRFPQFIDRFGKMHIPYRFRKRHHPDTVQDIRRKSFRQRPVQTAQQSVLQILNRPRIKERLFHLLGRIIEWCQPVGNLIRLIQRVYIRMGNIIDMPELGRFAKYDIINASLDLVQNIVNPFEPDQVDCARPIREFPDQPPCTPFTYRVEKQDTPFHLYIRHIPGHFCHLVETTTVNVFVRKVEQHIFIRRNTGFLLQYLRLFRADARQIHDGTFVEIEHIQIFILQAAPLPPTDRTES